MTDRDRVPESQTTSPPWRYRCPEGHVSITMNAHTFWCSTCGESYDKSELVDKASGGQHTITGP